MASLVVKDESKTTVARRFEKSTSVFFMPGNFLRALSTIIAQCGESMPTTFIEIVSLCLSATTSFSFVPTSRWQPTDSTIFARSASEMMLSSNSINADSEATLTEAECTPAVVPSTCSIVATQLAQCIPRILYVSFFILFFYSQWHYL